MNGKKTIKGLLFCVACLAALALFPGCTKTLADEGTLTIRQKETTSQDRTFRIYPMGAGSEIPRPLDNDSALTVSRIAEGTIKAGETAISFVLNVGDYYVYQVTTGPDIWRAAQVRRDREVVVAYP